MRTFYYTFLTILNYTPNGRRRRTRPQKLWENQVTVFMRSRNMEEDMTEYRYLGVWEWIDGSQLYKS